MPEPPAGGVPETIYTILACSAFVVIVYVLVWALVIKPGDSDAEIEYFDVSSLNETFDTMILRVGKEIA